MQKTDSSSKSRSNKEQILTSGNLFILPVGLSVWIRMFVAFHPEDTVIIRVLYDHVCHVNYDMDHSACTVNDTRINGRLADRDIDIRFVLNNKACVLSFQWNLHKHTSGISVIKVLFSVKNFKGLVDPVIF